MSQSKVKKTNQAWNKVLLSRAKNRPQSLDFINHVFDEFIPLSGDQYFGDDKAIMGGIATLGEYKLTVIGQHRGHSIEDIKITKNGMVSPEGYRKTLRLMKQAEKFHRPIITFIDTPGAFSGVDAETRGQAWSIAQNLLEMSQINSPILAIVISSGGSGGALAIAFADEVWMLENSYYSILSPEGFASILWKDSKKAPLAAQKMKSSPSDLKKFGLIDKIIKEPSDFKTQNQYSFFKKVKKQILEFLKEHKYKSNNSKKRIKKFQKMAFFNIEKP